MSDIEITKKFPMIPVEELAFKLGLNEDNIESYGKYKAKLSGVNLEERGKLILVTAMSPSPYGEGKTTVSIGLNDALCSLSKKSLLVLREPSLGPVFGVKGGATGGGYAQVVPMESINLHFTGDFHAITSANNLLSAAIDSHIFHGNELKIDVDTITFKRCLDINDRALRKIDLGTREESFQITAASELMTIFCLATDLDDLERRIGNILIGFNISGQPVLAKDLHVEGAMTVLLADAFSPNLVQTLENNPVLLHGGPFANIAHGCNSVIATKLGLSLADYVVTEAGFGADLGAEKFFDIKCRKASLKPSVVVLVATMKALKYNAYVSKEEILSVNPEAVKKGLANLKGHIDNLRKYNVPFLVALNRYEQDSDEEIKILKEFCDSEQVQFSYSSSYLEGGKGSIDLANKVLELSEKENNFKYLYDDSLSIKEKVLKVATEIYHANEVVYSLEAEDTLIKIEKLGLSKFPVCIAKTQYSFSDDPKKIGNPSDYTINVRNIFIYNGAEFIVVLLNDIMTMPGLPKISNYEKIKLDENKEIIGIF